jgi:integrase/recombinase XerC
MSPHTCRAYESDLSQFLVFLNSRGIHRVELVASLHVRGWMMDLMQSEVSPRSVNRKLSSLRAWFRYLRNQGSITTDPMSKVIAPKMPKHLVKDVPAADLHDMFQRFPWEEVEYGQRDRLLMLMLYTTGMRLSELIQLKWSDVDFYRKSLRVLGKRNKVREIPLHDELLVALKLYQAKQEGLSDFLFTRLSGSGDSALLPMYPMMVYRLVNHYLKLFSHASKTSPHVLRHSFATHMLNNGANLMAIKDLLGHANLSATQVYTKNTFEKLKKIHELHPRK